MKRCRNCGGMFESETDIQDVCFSCDIRRAPADDLRDQLTALKIAVGVAHGALCRMRDTRGAAGYITAAIKAIEDARAVEHAQYERSHR